MRRYTSDGYYEVYTAPPLGKGSVEKGGCGAFIIGVIILIIIFL